jgi:hypothetical protein
MEHEVKAVLVATAAASHALDAFFTAVADIGVVSDTIRLAWRNQHTRRRTQILETLQAAFLVAEFRDSWNNRLKSLFDLRNSALHYRSIPGPLVEHRIGVRTTPVAATYTLEAATASVDLMLDIIAICIRAPGPDPVVRSWSRTWAHAPADLEYQRSSKKASEGP